MCISVHPVLRREGHFIEVAAVVAAFTWLDEHGRPLETLAVRADKGHRYGACAPWRAAPSVRAHAAVVGPVEADTHTFSIGQADGLWGFLGRGALLPFLGLDDKRDECHSLDKNEFLIGFSSKIHQNKLKKKNQISFDFYLLLRNRRFKPLCTQTP